MRYLRDRRETHFQTSRCDSDKGEVRKPAEPISNLKTGVSATELSEVSSMDPASEDSFPSSEINVVDHDTEDNQSEYSDILEDSDVHEDSYADEDCSFNDEDSNAIDEDSDAIDEDSDVIDYDSDAIDEGSDAYDGDNDATVDDAESTNSQISVAYPEGTELLPSHSCGTLQDREIQMEVGECSHSRTLSQHLQQPLSKGSESSSSSPAPTNSCDETDGVENCYELYDPDSIVVEDCCSHPKPRSPKPASRKRPYNEVDDVRPGQWVAVSLADGTVIPALFVKHMQEKSEVAMMRTRKSGYDWGEVVHVKRSSVTCITDNPRLLPQVGSKSAEKRNVLYFE